MSALCQWWFSLWDARLRRDPGSSGASQGRFLLRPPQCIQGSSAPFLPGCVCGTTASPPLPPGPHPGSAASSQRGPEREFGGTGQGWYTHPATGQQPAAERPSPGPANPMCSDTPDPSPPAPQPHFESEAAILPGLRSWCFQTKPSSLSWPPWVSAAQPSPLSNTVPVASTRRHAGPFLATLRAPLAMLPLC